MISVTILNKDSERTLLKVLDSLKSFDDILILDTGSTDSSLEIAQRYPNVQIHKTAFTGFGELHNKASSLAKHDWILSLDSDEEMTPMLQKELQNTSFKKDCVYSFPMHNYYNGKFIKCCGWYPDRHIRLYNKTITAFTNAHVHEGIISKGLQEITLQSPVNHYSYASISDFLSKMQRYSDLFAEQNKGKKKSSLSKAILHGIGAFVKSFFIKKGLLGGYEGFVISIYNANTAFYKYLKLYEANNRL
ncbi:MAG: glycosyltransferase involved in cell wall biosynthesis [Chlamydiales bacterium]|jgi:glycosyltransferase involved in cell wall biosynthesis